MSLADYQSALPNHFPAAGTKSEGDGEAKKEENEKAGPGRAQSKGFADIIEHHSETLSGRDVEIIPIDQFLPNKKMNTRHTQKYEDHTVVLRRTWMQQGNRTLLIRIELEIQSEALCRAFRKIVVNSYEDADLQSFPIKLRSPFSELFFYRKEIKALAEDEKNDPELRREANVLYNFAQNNGLMSSIILDHERYSKEGQVVYDMLWTIYPPNSLVVLNVGTIRECWICRNVSIKQGRHGYDWEVTGFRIGFDGESPGLVRQTFSLPHMGMQVCKISDLPLIPIEHYRDWGTLEETLRTRSATLQNVLGKDLSLFSCQAYRGAAWKQSFSAYNTTFKPLLYAKQINERAIVDFKAYINKNRHSVTGLEDFKSKFQKSKAKTKARGMLINKDFKPKRRRKSPWDSDLEGSDNETAEPNLEDEEDVMAFKSFTNTHETKDEPQTSTADLPGLSEAVAYSFNVSKDQFELLFPALIPAFVLKEKEWLWLLSDELNAVKWNTVAFESLQLVPKTKDLIQALVKGHKIKSNVFDDVVPGKGQGLIFRLHGKPGLGKTLTAESVADYLERPLYSISGGELSTDVTKLEKRLDEIFDLVKRWNAVSLLDEADVLFCKRNSAEIDRNAIVAVFLRKIEYFQGVLFLTTNRKEDFDDAFKSRIHVTISYSDLSEDAQSNIWKKLITTNSELKVDDSWTEDVFSALGKLNFNGRTIKNVLRTAVAYAHANDEPLGAHHVSTIVSAEVKEVGDLNKVVNTPDERQKRFQVESGCGDI